MIEPRDGMNWAWSERDLNRGWIGRAWVQFLNTGQRKWQGKMEILVAQPDFECTHGGVRCTHVRMSFHVWEIQIRWHDFG
jgi:hypothetical protein